MNGRYVSEKPSLAFHSRLVRAPRALDPLEVDAHRRVDVRARRLRPHHVLGGAAADVVERRRPRRRLPRATGAGAGGGRAARAPERSRGRRCGAGAAAPPSRAAASTSLRVMRPPSPVPRICAGSSPCSAISRRTIGDATTPAAVAGGRCRAGRGRGCRRGGRLAGAGRRRRRRLAPRRLRGSAAPAAAAPRARLGRRARAPRPRAGAGGGAPAPRRRRSRRGGRRPRRSRLRARGSRTRHPRDGAGTSESTLSVETSNSGSSASIVLADLLEPARDRALGDGLAQLRHRHVHADLLARHGSASRVSCAGCGR